MSVRLVRFGNRQIRQPTLWADVIRPNRTLAEDLILTLDGLTRRDDLQVILGCVLSGQWLGQKLADSM